MQLFHRHVFRRDVDVEQRAELPRAVADDPALLFQSVIQRGARECRQKRHLHLVKPRLTRKVEHFIEHLRRVAIEAEDETTIHRDAVRLDLPDRGEVAVALARFPIVVQLDPIKAGLARAFQTDEDLLAAGVAHETQQLVVLSHFHVRLGKPPQLFLRQFAQQLFVVFAMHKAVVVGELDERARPDFFDLADFGDDFLDRLEFVARREEDRTCAEIASVRAAAARLHGDPVVFVRIQQIEPRHRRLPKIEPTPRRLNVKRFQMPALEIVQHRGPERFPLPDRDARAMLPGFLRQGPHRNAAHYHGNFLAAIKVGHLPRFFQLRREGAERDQVEMVRQVALLPQFGDFVILDVEFARCQSGECQQTEARQRSDNAIAVHESGQSETESGEFLVVRAHAAHGDETDPFHNLMTSQSVNVPPVIRLTTGIRNSARSRGRCARTKQQMGIVTAPRTNPHDATVTGIEA